jgi:cysteine desulfurase
MSVYLDNSATTRIYPEALKKYNEVSEDVFGNPSSLHTYGFKAEAEIKAAKTVILKSLG